MATPAPSKRPDDGRDVDENRDPKTGRFGPGYKGGRKHRIDLLSVCDRMAREEGIDLESLLWSVVKGLFVQAAKGDTNASRMLFERLCVSDAPKASDATDITPGPPVPGALDFRKEVRELLEWFDHDDEPARSRPRIIVEPTPTPKPKRRNGQS